MPKRKTKAQTLLEEAVTSTSSTATSGKVLDSRLKQIERELKRLWVEHTKMLVKLNRLKEKND